MRRPLQRRRQVETFAVHHFETTVAQNVGGRYLSEAHVTQFRLLHGLRSEVDGLPTLSPVPTSGTFPVTSFGDSFT